MRVRLGPGSGYDAPAADAMGLVLRARRHAPSVLFALAGDGEVLLQRVRGPLDVRVGRRGSHVVDVPLRPDGRRRRTAR